MDYSMGVDPDDPHQRNDRVCIVPHHPDFYRILTGKQLHFEIVIKCSCEQEIFGVSSCRMAC
jgi:hypothetical protein